MVKSTNHWSSLQINSANRRNPFQVTPANHLAQFHNNFPSNLAPFHVKSDNRANFSCVQLTIPIQMYSGPFHPFPITTLETRMHFFHIPEVISNVPSCTWVITVTVKFHIRDINPGFVISKTSSSEHVMFPRYWGIFLYLKTWKWWFREIIDYVKSEKVVALV